jgi:virginiamycin A acetyltransferase
MTETTISAIPSLHEKQPVKLPDGTVWPHTVFLKNYIDHPHISIGDYTYFNDFRLPVADVRRLLVPYMHLTAPEKLVIGKFVQIAHGTQFITSSANHQMSGFSTYPFAVFGAWSQCYQPDLPNKGDTIVGNDVWFGHESLIMPAISIGDGAIIASRSVVTKNVPPYTIVGGNPARIIRKRFEESIINELLTIQWWHWPIELITKNMAAIVSADINLLKMIHKTR